MKILIGSHNEPDINFNRLDPAHPVEFPVLDHPKELCLGTGGHIPNLIHKQGSAVGQFKPAKFLSLRPGKRSLFMTKQFALQEILGDGPTIHRYEGRLRPGAVRMNGPCYELLPRTRFPHDDYGEI